MQFFKNILSEVWLHQVLKDKCNTYENMVKITRKKIKIKSNPKRVLPLFLDLNYNDRIYDIISKISSLNNNAIEEILNNIFKDFEKRHHDFKNIILDHYQKISKNLKLSRELTLSQKLLIGSYYTKEYSIESAALFNPSIVIHPNQDNINDEMIRFIMSLRATGEGHISSITFRTGLISKNGEIFLDKALDKVVAAKKVEDIIYNKSFLSKRAKYDNRINTKVFEFLPDAFSMKEVQRIIAEIEQKKILKLYETEKAISDIFDNNYEVTFNKNIPLNSKVIFPVSKAESQGMEDVRFVKFSEDNEVSYFGTYTAYNGKDIHVHLINTNDFNTFSIRSLYGKATMDKGMALFPEKINGKFAMLSRQGGSCISIMYSDDIYFWEDYKVIQKPEREWEMLQLGNAGSPIKTLLGWLLLTHAVGPLRKYVLSATLLDINNPEKVLASLSKPLISPNSSEREGYVPNVVYTCGLIYYGDKLFIPYAMSDSATSFVTVDLNLLLKELQKNIK